MRDLIRNNRWNLHTVLDTALSIAAYIVTVAVILSIVTVALA